MVINSSQPPRAALRNSMPCRQFFGAFERGAER
jgi:hypothetical protein